jgi:predicted glycosyltransferase
MRVLFDITHPAHVHFYRNLHQRLIDSGHDVLVVGREKDVTLELLDAYRISHLIHGRSGSRGLIRQGIELASRVAYLVRHGRRFRPDLVLTRNPAGVQAARVIGALGVFDTDDAQSVGLHFRAAAPFADVITGPDGIEGSLGKKERRYPSYKPLAYLHPDLYEPVDPRAQLGLEPGERYSVLRLVAHDASHDRGIEGLDRSSVRRIIELVASIGPVFATVEPGAEAAGMVRSLDVPPERLHDVLAHAAVLVGDSQSVTAEAAVLGTPAFRINSWAGRTPLTDLSAKYEVAHSFLPEEIDAALEAIADALRPEAKEEWARKREVLLADKVNLTDWYWDLVHDLAS